MSVEERLRTALSRDAAGTATEPEIALRAVLRRHGRRRAARSAVAGLASAAAVLAVVLGVPWWDDRAVAPAEPGQPGIVGEYVVDVAPGPRVSRDLAGRWTVVVDPDGRLHIVAPAGYAGVVSGSAYRLKDDLVHTDALVSAAGCQNQLQPGTYRWSDSGGQLTFAVVDDHCPARRTLFAGQPWQRVP